MKAWGLQNYHSWLILRDSSITKNRCAWNNCMNAKCCNFMWTAVGIAIVTILVLYACIPQSVFLSLKRRRLIQIGFARVGMLTFAIFAIADLNFLHDELGTTYNIYDSYVEYPTNWNLGWTIFLKCNEKCWTLVLWYQPVAETFTAVSQQWMADATIFVAFFVLALLHNHCCSLSEVDGSLP